MIYDSWYELAFAMLKSRQEFLPADQFYGNVPHFVWYGQNDEQQYAIKCKMPIDDKLNLNEDEIKEFTQMFVEHRHDIKYLLDNFSGFELLRKLVCFA